MEREKELFTSELFVELQVDVLGEVYRQGNAGINHELKLCMGKDVGFSYHQLTQDAASVPVTVFAADHDAMTPPAVGNTVARSIAHSTLVQVEDATHALCIVPENTMMILTTLSNTLRPHHSDKTAGDTPAEHTTIQILAKDM